MRDSGDYLVDLLVPWHKKKLTPGANTTKKAQVFAWANEGACRAIAILCLVADRVHLGCRGSDLYQGV